MERVLSQTLNGVSYGFILFLVASGLTITLGLLRRFNLAHGAMYMVGGYVAWDLAQHSDAGFWIALPVGGIIVTLLGLLVDVTILRRLGENLGGTVLGTFGVLTIVTNVVEWIWNSESKAPAVPNLLSGSAHIGSFAYPWVRLGAIVFGVVLALALWYLQDRTVFGWLVKAAMDDSETASAVGINVPLLSRVAFAAGAFVAGVSGAFGQAIGGLSPGLGISTLLLALIVIILGGLGSLQGALLGGIILGLANAFGTVYFPHYVGIAPYGLMIAVLVFRPQGLLGEAKARTG